MLFHYLIIVIALKLTEIRNLEGVRYRARCAPCQMPHKCHFWLLFKVCEATRALGARASACANFWPAPSDRKSKMQNFMYL